MRMSAEKGQRFFFRFLFLYYYKKVQPVSNNLQGNLNLLCQKPCAVKGSLSSAIDRTPTTLSERILVIYI